MLDIRKIKENPDAVNVTVDEENKACRIAFNTIGKHLADSSPFSAVIEVKNFYFFVKSGLSP